VASDQELPAITITINRNSAALTSQAANCCPAGAKAATSTCWGVSMMAKSSRTTMAPV